MWQKQQKIVKIGHFTLSRNTYLVKQTVWNSFRGNKISKMVWKWLSKYLFKRFLKACVRTSCPTVKLMLVLPDWVSSSYFNWNIVRCCYSFTDLYPFSPFQGWKNEFVCMMKIHGNSCFCCLVIKQYRVRNFSTDCNYGGLWCSCLRVFPVLSAKPKWNLMK